MSSIPNSFILRYSVRSDMKSSAAASRRRPLLRRRARMICSRCMSALVISRGGSSTIFTTIALGMILSVSRQNDEQSHDRPKSETLYEK